jgi:hypothetical protein
MSPADDRALSHVLLTRFNLPTPGPESLVRAQDGWLRARWELFSRYTVPSVMAQTERNFRWIIYFDTESPQWLLGEISRHRAQDIYTALFRTSVGLAELVDDIRSVLPAPTPRLLTTNLDNDDGLAADFVARLQSLPSTTSRSAVYLVNGLIRSGRRIYRRTDRNNAFCSVLEDWDDPATCWRDWHILLGRHMPVVEVGGQPAWLQVVHGTNVSNRVHGRLAAPGRFRQRFRGLLDDVPEPRWRELVADSVLFSPARVVRDASRAVAKASVMRVLGKDGLDRLKLTLSRLRKRSRAAI